MKKIIKPIVGDEIEVTAVDCNGFFIHNGIVEDAGRFVVSFEHVKYGLMKVGHRDTLEDAITLANDLSELYPEFYSQLETIKVSDTGKFHLRDHMPDLERRKGFKRFCIGTESR